MEFNKLRWPPRVTLGRLLPHARGLGFKPRREGFPSGAKKEWGLSSKAKVRVLHTAQLDVTRGGGYARAFGKRVLQKVKEDGFIDVKGKIGEFLYRVTEDSLMERLNTNMHEACLQIDKDCSYFSLEEVLIVTIRIWENAVIVLKYCTLLAIVAYAYMAISDGSDEGKKVAKQAKEVAKGLNENARKLKVDTPSKLPINKETHEAVMKKIKQQADSDK
nr:hypothetical protein [Tanacetum cinerariifolium]